MRFGAAFDLFGDGSTAVKFSGGRYVANEGTGVTQGYNPIYPYNLIDYRPWTDLNGDLTALNPDGTPQLDEIGASFNPNYGTSVIDTQYDPDLPRASNWEYSAGVERQLGKRLGAERDVAPARLYELRLGRQPEHLGGRLAPCGHVDRAGRRRSAPERPRRAGAHLRHRPRPRHPDRERPPDPRGGGLPDVERVRGDSRRRAPPRRLHDRERHRRHEHEPLLSRGQTGHAERPCVSARRGCRTGPWASCRGRCRCRSTP